MKRFILLFHGAEGTSPIVRILNNFERVNVVHQVENRGWEPFDVHNCGDITMRNLDRCFHYLFESPDRVDFDALNKIYCRSAKRPIESFDPRPITGFKMRLFNFGYLSKGHSINRLPGVLPLRKVLHRNAMLSLFRKYNIAIFISVRQDVFRRSLSKYHGEVAQGGKRHLQFRMASGEISRDEIPMIKVDRNLFARYVQKCKADIESKRKLYELLQRKGVRVYPLLYEEFLNKPADFFRKFFAELDESIDDAAIDAALSKGTSFRKVHGDDIRDYVTNHEELLAEFGQEYVAWDRA